MALPALRVLVAMSDRLIVTENVSVRGDFVTMSDGDEDFVRDLVGVTVCDGVKEFELETSFVTDDVTVALNVSVTEEECVFDLLRASVRDIVNVKLELFDDVKDSVVVRPDTVGSREAVCEWDGLNDQVCVGVMDRKVREPVCVPEGLSDFDGDGVSVASAVGEWDRVRDRWKVHDMVNVSLERVRTSEAERERDCEVVID